MEMIKNAKTDEEKHAVIWSVSNLVPLKQFKPGESKSCITKTSARNQRSNCLSSLPPLGKRITDMKNDSINRPSQTTRAASAVVDGTDKISAWKKKLSDKQIKNILRVVEAFGLGHLYDDSVFPLNKDAD
jgi:hypothetical protein